MSDLLLRIGRGLKVFKLKVSRARQDLRSYCRWALLFYFNTLVLQRVHVLSHLTAEPFDLRPWFLSWWSPLTLARIPSQVKVISQISRPNSDKMCFVVTGCCHLLCFWVEVKVKGWVQIQVQKSQSRSEVKGSVQQRALSSSFEPKMTITSARKLCVYNWRFMQKITHTWSISFPWISRLGTCSAGST